MDGIKRREAAEIHITSVSSLERIVVGRTPAEVLSSFSRIQFSLSLSYLNFDEDESTRDYRTDRLDRFKTKSEWYVMHA